MENNIKASNFGQFTGVIALILSVSAGFSLVLFFVIFNASIYIAIPFAVIAFFLAVLGIIFGKIGICQVKKGNSSLLIPKTGLIVGIIIVSIYFVGLLPFLVLMGIAMMY
ncbi:hypothetical protein [Flavobacterium collinsii]|uniref:DUF4190 domain-containing protein n=1 Tax=Flavobacterium collinsii TaxID=1114861 RepID=A0ABN7ELJ1_9FLAO|nr:hypothetical protein [Flavobacterium collinsii]CAA9199985.1 hypothetical protein FLACOL7796_02984 [Flavobacterium collinsii]